MDARSTLWDSGEETATDLEEYHKHVAIARKKPQGVCMQHAFCSDDYASTGSRKKAPLVVSAVPKALVRTKFNSVPLLFLQYVHV